jgi:hypothetical protein
MCQQVLPLLPAEAVPIGPAAETQVLRPVVFDRQGCGGRRGWCSRSAGYRCPNPRYRRTVAKCSEKRPFAIGSVTMSPLSESKTADRYATFGGLAGWKDHEAKNSDQWATMGPSFNSAYFSSPSDDHNPMAMWAGLCTGGYAPGPCK